MKLFSAVWVTTVLAITGANAEAGDDKGAGKGKNDPQAMMEAMEKAGTPGEHHKVLLKRVGKWDVVVKAWMAPGQPPMESKGTAEAKSILGDRFIQMNFTGSFMDKPFNGIGVTGFDNVKKKVVGTWIDNMSTSIMRSEGTFDAASKTTSSTSVGMDPITGKECKGRTVEKWESDNKVVEEFFRKVGSKEMKAMEIVYTRAGK